jgi:hypothetical protein
VSDDLAGEQLARRVAVVMGIGIAEARVAVHRQEAERRRRLAIAAGLEKCNYHPVKLVSDQDGGAGCDGLTSVIAVTVKLCQRCGHLLPVAEFAINRTARTGRSSWCRGCMSDYRKEHRDKQQAAGPVPGMRRCSRCTELKALDEYDLCPTSADGRRATCRGCTKPRPGRPPGSARPYLTDEQREQVSAMLAERKPYNAIVAATGVSAGSVSRIRNGKV